MNNRDSYTQIGMETGVRNLPGRGTGFLLSPVTATPSRKMG